MKDKNKSQLEDRDYESVDPIHPARDTMSVVCLYTVSKFRFPSKEDKFLIWSQSASFFTSALFHVIRQYRVPGDIISAFFP